ncbi:bifunctional oligoribonuclease/PAP phosphatase NrnA [Hymenobacter busanensis]|uniref:Bifunctional oligoribonuclease/PAP phosphatase NrnA n=1 Tax=Hymenobacter busanensis TaxID=2607656 RepID=A0A7L4ZWU7_9BACT|nr:DHH family phosphoesterase [Hymenobacter busanensis]KAA9325309.1 bifunctional oligoribonuclease/PAP phosphatase NrnA [Hymenobacter busanensis]QHJ07698.1 bifunctional oligoribonuclease/PAP phosphatase NrnA [Hymenobacter busanensis]
MHDVTALKELLREPKHVFITTHHKPDADALGSSLGLAGYLRKKGHHVTVVTPSDYPDFLSWMPGNEDVVVYDPRRNDRQVREIIGTAEVLFCLDFSALSRIHELGEYVRQAPGTKVLVDHHEQPEPFADIAFSFPTAAATAELIFEIIRDLGDQALITPAIGECLYAGIMTDTGSFRHPSTSRNVHLIIAELLDAGIDLSSVHRRIYDSHSEERLRFLGFVLKDKLRVLREYNTAYIAITADELKQYHSKTGDTEGLVNFALSIEGIVFAAILIDRVQAVKISFRSVGSFSVSEFSRRHFNGGGHHNAAGGISHEPLEATVQKFLSLLPDYQADLVTAPLAVAPPQ